jgi:hypothetical protein
MSHAHLGRREVAGKVGRVRPRLVSDFSVLGAVRRFSRPLALDGGGCFWRTLTLDSVFGRNIDVARLMNLRRL